MNILSRFRAWRQSRRPARLQLRVMFGNQIVLDVSQEEIERRLREENVAGFRINAKAVRVIVFDLNRVKDFT